MSVNEANPSELESLKQRITELEAENAELRKENTVIPDLRIKLSIFDAEIAELKRRNAEVLRANGEYNERRDAENAKLKARIEELEKNNTKENAELRDRVTKVEQNQLQNDSKGNNTPNNNSSNFNLGADQGSLCERPHHEKSSQEKEMDNFLDEAHKKSVGEDIRRRNKEKKLQRESANQDSIPDTAYVSETVNIPTVDSKVSHDIKPVNRISENSELSRDKKPVTVSNRFSENSESSYERETIANTPTIFCPEIETNVETAPPAINDANERALVTEFVQDLLRELLSPDSQLQAIKFSPPRTLIPGSLSIKKLANFFCQANNARDKSIVAKRSEITLWCLFSERFDDKVVELRSNDKKRTDQTARKQIYNEMKPYLTGVSDGYLRTMTCRARKINKLFGYEYDPVTLEKIKGIGGHMVQRVTYSAYSISKLTNPQIRYIIDQVNSKTVNDQSHVTETFPPANPQESERTDEMVRAEEEFLVSLGVSDDRADETTQPKAADNGDDASKVTDNVDEDIAGPRGDKSVATRMIFDDDFFSDKPVDSNHSITNVDTAVNDVEDIVTRKIFDDSSEDEESQNETLTCSSNSDSDSDYDESMEQLHDELTRKEMARLKALEAIDTSKITPPIKIFDDLKLLDDDLFSSSGDVPVDSNHPINTQSEGIAVQA